ncbi:DUF4239 domain-containing protein [Lutimonas halocynthiae]|uniref:bestrophin-like domain n=1 Tax=Lutimonas halocynthiae TaxID=1446477 RepID=UPI0025B490C2|nr:DUF4239 domain-containing protein [Lutimonas halocynthiae]MDN3644314.1 DUF4239 domain-containing protein [Lutimonas halocynthiae]
MEILLELPLLLGLFITVLSISLAGILVAVISKNLIANRFSKQHERIGRLLFRVVAGLIALLVSLSYANERVRQSKIINSMEEEASIIVNLSMRLHHFESVEAKNALEEIVEYVDLTINDDWKNVSENPYFSKATQSLVKANSFVLNMPVSNETERFEKQMIISLLNDIIKLTQIRVYSQHVTTPHLIYILLCGLTIMWIFFSVYKLDSISLSFLSLYNILIAILIFFIFSLRNPFMGPLKIKPHSLIIVKTKGFDQYFK